MSDLREVRLSRLPIAARRRTAEHFDGLLREFALLEVDRTAAPARLLDLRCRLEQRFGGFSQAPTAEIEEAAARGASHVDLTYAIPAEAGAASAELLALMEEADEFCRSGDLLTLAAPDEVVRFRRWFLGEFVRQCAGGQPQSWPGD